MLCSTTVMILVLGLILSAVTGALYLQSPEVSFVPVCFPFKCTLLLPHAFPCGHSQTSKLKGQFGYDCSGSALFPFLPLYLLHTLVFALCSEAHRKLQHLTVPKNTQYIIVSLPDSKVIFIFTWLLHGCVSAGVFPGQDPAQTYSRDH